MKLSQITHNISKIMGNETNRYCYFFI